jgi:hypothetical protein
MANFQPESCRNVVDRCNLSGRNPFFIGKGYVTDRKVRRNAHFLESKYEKPEIWSAGGPED